MTSMAPAPQTHLGAVLSTASSVATDHEFLSLTQIAVMPGDKARSKPNSLWLIKVTAVPLTTYGRAYTVNGYLSLCGEEHDHGSLCWPTLCMQQQQQKDRDSDARGVK